MKIRLATQNDVEHAVRIVRAVYEEYGFTWDPEVYHADLYDLEGHYLRLGNPFWLAEWEGLPVGTVALEVFDPLPEGDGKICLHEGKVRVAGADCSLERLYVHPEARRRGIGGALTAQVIEEAKRRGRTRMELWSDKRFGPAHQLYGGFGAEVVGDRICDDPDVSPEWGLRIDLEPAA